MGSFGDAPRERAYLEPFIDMQKNARQNTTDYGRANAEASVLLSIQHLKLRFYLDWWTCTADR